MASDRSSRNTHTEAIPALRSEPAQLSPRQEGMTFNYDPTPVTDWFEDAAEYTEIRAAETKVGDVTPAGVIDEWEAIGELLIVHLTIRGRKYVRKFDDLIGVENAR